MWPSEETASAWYNVANFCLIASLAIGVISTLIIVKMGNAKEQYLQQHLADTNKRTAEAQEHEQKLEQENLKLSGGVAGLQKEASEAKAAQQVVEIELAKQQAKTAKAESDLLEVRKRQEPRNLYAVDVVKLEGLLSGKPNSPVVISCIAGDVEGCSFARQIKDVLVAVGWNVSGVNSKSFPGTFSGLHIHVHAWIAEKEIPVGALVLNDALTEMGMRPGFAYRHDLPPDLFELIVGYR